jgi:pyridoxine 5-phosphate synthase
MLREVTRTGFRLEISPKDDAIAVCLAVRPAQILLCEDLGSQSYALSHIDLSSKADSVKGLIETFREADIEVGVRIHPSTQQLKLASQLGFQFAEVSLARFAFSFGSREGTQELENIRDVASLAQKVGFRLAAGQGVDFRNVYSLLDQTVLQEYTVGQAITSRALLIGITEAVKQMATLLRRV